MRLSFADAFLLVVFCGAGWHIGSTTPGVWTALWRTLIFPFLLGEGIAAWLFP